LGASHDDYDNGPEGRIGELVRYFLRLGCLGFGGPVALVDQMERELVNDRQWLTKEQMHEAIAICQSLPRTACHSGRHLCVLPA
jgi:chromate transporter